MSRFFWQSDEQKRKYRLAKWDILCQPKNQGGLGIHNLDIKNTTLLSKWLFKLLTRSFIRLCVSLLYRGQKCFKVFVSPQCNDLEINKAFLIEKNDWKLGIPPGYIDAI